jgi:hypothetical protein
LYEPRGRFVSGKNKTADEKHVQETKPETNPGEKAKRTIKRLQYEKVSF